MGRNQRDVDVGDSTSLQGIKGAAAGLVGGVDGGAHGDSLVGVLNLRLLAEEAFDRGLHGGDAGGAAGHKDLLDV